jgi:putative nucleotidyltransferase with HDIG domain
MIPARLAHLQVTEFFEIRLRSVVPNIPLPFDIYLMVAQKPTLFRKMGDTLTPERIKLLINHGGNSFLVPEDQRDLYLSSIKFVIANPESTTELKSQFIKESAFLHIQDLFTKKDIAQTVSESKSLIEEMVSFVTADVNAVASLMRLSVHDYYTYNHCVDVAVYSIAIAKKLYGEDKNMLFMAGMGGLLHDVGKRKIDPAIINKASALTRDEWEEVKKHPTYGREVLEEVPSIPVETRAIVYEHHENFDGTGYPSKLKEEEISQLARVVSIADVFDALTTDRSYHKAVGPQEALDTMYGMQPGKFDPQIFHSFNKNFTKKAPFELPKDFDPCQAGSLAEVLKIKK